MAQLLETKAASLRVQGDVYRNYDPIKGKGESFNESVKNLDNLMKNLFFTKYTFDITATPNKARIPAPEKDSKGNVTKWTYLNLKYYAKEWNGTKWVYKDSKGKFFTKTVNAVIPRAYESLNVSDCYLCNNTLHFYFSAQRGMPKIFGDGNMHGGVRMKKESVWDEKTGLFSNWGGKSNQIWQKIQWTKNSEGKYVWTKIVSEKSAATQPSTTYSTDKNKKYKYTWRRKKYWAPIQIDWEGKGQQNRLICRSYNHLYQIVSYTGFKGDITNQRIGTIKIYDENKRIKGVHRQSISNGGISGSGASTVFVKNIQIKPASDKPKGQYITMDLYLAALDNRIHPTTHINGWFNLPVLLNISAYEVD